MSSEDETAARLDRHALVWAVWLPAGFVALGLMHYGFRSGGAWWVAAGFVAVAGGFAAHVIVNAVLGTGFTAREVGLGMALYATGTVALVLAVLVDNGFAGQFFLTATAGMIGLLLAAVFHMLTRFGPRAAFEKFDIIRDNNPRSASRLIRGGRR